MKRFLIGFLVFVVVIVVATIAIAPRIIPTTDIVAKIADQVKAKTGRDFTVKGPVTISLLPHIALEAEEVSLGNAPGFEPAEQASLAKLTVRVAFWPLFGGNLKIESLELDSPRIELVSNGPGNNNWSFGKAGEAEAPATEAAPAEKGAEEKGGPVPGLVDISLADVRLEKGTLVFTNARTGEKREIDNIDASLSLPDLEQALSVSANIVYNKQKVIAKFGAAKPRQFLSGEASPVTLNINSNPIKGSFSGNATLSEGLGLSGDVTLNLPSLRDFAIWSGVELPATQGGLGPLAIKGKLERSGSELSFNGVEVSLDSLKGTGDVVLNVKGAKPHIKGRLEVEQLDLNPYVTAAPAKASEATAADAKAPAAAQEETPSPDTAAVPAVSGWSEEPIDLSALAAVDADFAFEAKSVLYHALKVGESSLTLQIKDGKATAEIAKTALYDGTGKGRIVLDGSKSVPAVALNFSLAGIQAQPLLADAVGFDRVSGKATGDIALSGTGKSERDIIGTLDGKGSFNLTEGSVKGINVATLVQDVTGSLRDAAAQAEEKTDFSEASLTFTVAKGVVKNQDLSLKSAVVGAAGAGQVDLPNRTVDYRIDPRLGGKAGSFLPVIVKGSFDHLTYQPDLQAIAKNPAQALKNLKEGGKESAKKLLNAVKPKKAAKSGG